jgi:hypothetical protein
MAVILVLSGLCLAILARTVSALGAARVAQDAASAIAAADGGIADAVYVLDHTTAGGPTYTGTVGSATWTATVTSPSAAIVTSTGRSGTIVRAVQTTLTRGPRWPWLIATTGSLVLDAHVALPSNGVLAAGGALVLRTGVTGGGGEDLLGPGASCSGCTAPPMSSGPTELPATTTLADPSGPPLGASTPPGGCTGITSLVGGPFVCNGNVSFAPGSATVTGPVELWVTSTGGPATVSFAGSSVNASGSANNFIIHVVGAGVVEPGDGNGHGSFTGIIDAPRSTLRSGDCQFALTGAADLGSFNCLSTDPTGPALTYDPDVADIPSTTWQAGPYQDLSGP